MVLSDGNFSTLSRTIRTNNLQANIHEKEFLRFKTFLKLFASLNLGGITYQKSFSKSLGSDLYKITENHNSVLA